MHAALPSPAADDIKLDCSDADATDGLAPAEATVWVASGSEVAAVAGGESAATGTNTAAAAQVV